MKDLDLNGDGVIDEEEFSRWYFSGMKAYNGEKKEYDPDEESNIDHL